MLLSYKKLFKNKRQWGTERDTTPLSNLHEVPTNRKITLSRVAIVMTIVLWAMYVTSVIVRQLIEGPQSYQFTMEVFGYLLVMSFLTFSALMYLLARHGALQRFKKHSRIPRALIDKYFSKKQPTITVLVPSYSEEVSVIRKTLLSAALQEYPDTKVVLLLDDDRTKIKPEGQDRFDKTIKLSADINDLLNEPLKKFKNALSDLGSLDLNKESDYETAIKQAVKNYNWAADWLDELADNEKIEDHVDIFFTDQVLRELGNELRVVGEALSASQQKKVTLPKDRIYHFYRRLLWIFSAEISTFERKRFASLSHEANKAMNLNSYIGLMGGNYDQKDTPDGLILAPTKNAKNADLVIPDSDYLLTLDADSILLRDYCLRLIYFLEQPDNQDVAVTQTPYSSFRGAPTRIERLAGATTDIQHILHQGMTYYGATFWVGANAVIRKKALEDIVEKEWIGGHEIKRYVQDRTVIEDTESSVDLALNDWKLINYPERLSYSATPPDFGSLVVQRRRWANGGLLIMMKMWPYVQKCKKEGKPISRSEILLRVNYMASIAWASFGLIFLLAYPYDGRLLSPLVLLAAVPYFWSMASDLKYCRYKYSDIFRIYGFNLILLPVNLAGVFKSIQQAITTQKIPFARTPKIKDRTAAGLPYLIIPLFIVAFSIFIMVRNIETQNWGNAAFAGFNAFTATWAIIAYIGIRNLFVDVWYAVVNMLYVEVPVGKAENKRITKPTLDWKGILYHGEVDQTLSRRYQNKLTFNNDGGI